MGLEHHHILGVSVSHEASGWVLTTPTGEKHRLGYIPDCLPHQLVGILILQYLTLLLLNDWTQHNLNSRIGWGLCFNDVIWFCSSLPPHLLYASGFSVCSKFTRVLPFFAKNILLLINPYTGENPNPWSIPAIPKWEGFGSQPVLPRNESSSRETTAEIFRSDEPWAMATSDPDTNPQLVEPKGDIKSKGQFC